MPLEQETGQGVATEMYNQLDNLGIKDQVVIEVQLKPVGPAAIQQKY